MKKIKIGLGGLIMMITMTVSDNARVFTVYILAAILHELGHIVAAKLMDIKIKEVKFEFSGIRICTDCNLTSYKKELILAASGPAVNIVVFFISATAWRIKFGTVCGMFEYASVFMSESGDGKGMIAFFALSSLVQAMANLIPVESFDGGRILNCVLSECFNEVVGSKVLEITGALTAFFLWTVSLYLMLKISSGLGIYVFAVCIFVNALKNRFK